MYCIYDMDNPFVVKKNNDNNENDTNIIHVPVNNAGIFSHNKYTGIE